MFVVALAELGTSVEDETPVLAEDLGITAYEARLRLAAGLPCVILATQNRALALEMLRKLRARGHGAVAFDAHAVVPATSMIAVRQYRLEPDALELDPSDGAAPSAARLPFVQMTVLLRATHRSSHEQRADVKEVKLRPMAAIATGGLILTKTVNKQVRSTVEEREQVLYVFGTATVPWLLRESTAQASGLADAMHPTRVLNFMACVRALRERAPHAVYDDRLLAIKKLPEAPVDPSEGRGRERVAGGIDLLAHALALWLSRKGAPRID